MEAMELFDVFYDDDVYDGGAEKETPTEVTAREAFVLSINRCGRVNLEYMAKCSGRTEKQLVKELEGVLIWKDPRVYTLARPYEGWVAREQYVRGNVYRLLEEAKQKHRKTGLYGKNIELLEASLPDGPGQEDIVVTLGATWVPKDVYQKYLCELLDILNAAYAPTVEFDAYFGRWYVKGGVIYNKARNESVYGTKRMTAETIFERTLNAAPIRVHDYEYDYETGKMKAVLNKAETLAAQEKQNLILWEFEQWLHRKKQIMTRLQELYTDRFGYQLPHYDGAFLELPGMQPAIELYGHQRAAIARIVLSPNNVLLSHDVGAGKTYAFTAGIHERLRMGLSRKALLVVPNAVFAPTVAAIQTLYPGEDFTPISVKDFAPAKREKVLLQMQEAQTGFFVLAASSFDMIGISKEYHLQKKEAELVACGMELEAARDYSRRDRLREKHERLTKAIEKIKETEEKFTDCFDKMHFDLLVVDECHNYKNISLEYNMDPIVGLHAKGSKKADLMLEKCDFVRENGGKLLFATGTPLTNSLADLFVLQRYLQPEELEVLKISQFHTWVSTFCTKHTEFEIDPSAASFRLVTRFDRFHNLPELMALFGNVCDFYTVNADDMLLPEFEGHKNISVQRSKEQEAYIKKIVARTEAIRSREVKPTEDNYLKVTTDGKKCALDVRLVVPKLIGKERTVPGKTEAAAENICRIYREYPGTTQAVFCDISTPGKDFNVYGEMRRLLVEDGVPEEEIAFIHEATTDAAREKLIQRFNAGKIRVLIGSTAKLGLGVNIQERLVAVHHLDAPWKPSDMVQREGRAIRQGNLNEQVFIYRYVTESSFDAYTWQILENKQRFIASFLSGTLDRSQRTEQDIGDMVLNYAEIKALAIGNPLIKERVEVSNRIAKARANAVQRRQELHTYQKALVELPKKRYALLVKLNAVKDDIRFAQTGVVRETPATRTKIGKEILLALVKYKDADEDMEVGFYRGFKVIVPANANPDKPFILLSRSPSIAYRVDMKDAKERGCSVRMDTVLGKLSEERDRLQNRLDGLRGEIADAEEQLHRGNPYDGEIAQYTARLAEIDVKLREAM